MTETEQSESDEATTLGLMFDEARQGQATVSQWADAIDAKVLTVFGGVSVLIGAIPAIGGVKAHGWEWTPWIVAAVAWAITSVLCSLAYGTRAYLLGPDPSVLLDDAWTSLSPREYRRNRLHYMGVAWGQNRQSINEKAERLSLAIPFVAIESGALLAALMIQR